MDFMYQIKSKDDRGQWIWPPLHTDKITANSSKEARKMLEEEYGMGLQGRGLKGDPNAQYLLTLVDITDKAHLQDRFIEKTCRECGATYTLNSKYQLQIGGNREDCSALCTETRRIREGGLRYTDVNFDYTGIHEPVIYKITCRLNGLCYIGKTTQAVTLRWYQHIYHHSGTTLHDAIRRHGLEAWIFEILEVIQIPPEILYDKEATKNLIAEKEQYYMDMYDSVNSGYNMRQEKKKVKQEIEDDPTLF